MSDIQLNGEDRVKLKQFITEISNCVVRRQAELDLINSIRQKAKEELGIAPKMLNTLVKHYNEGTIKEFVDQNEEVKDVYELLFGQIEE